MVEVGQRRFWAMWKGQSTTRTGRLYWRDAPGRSFVLLCTTRQGQCQLAIYRAWWRSGFGCLIWDLIEISPLVSRDPYNLRQRPGLGSCLNSRPLSDFLSGRKFLPKCWSRLLLHLQGRNAAGIVVQILPRFGWGKCQCLLLDRIRFWTTWRHDLPWRAWGPRESFPVCLGTAPGLGIYRESKSSGMRDHCDILRWSPEGRRAWGVFIASAERETETLEGMVWVGEVCSVWLKEEEGGWLLTVWAAVAAQSGLPE